MTEEEFRGRPTQAPRDANEMRELNEAFRKGLGDAALSMDERDAQSPFPATLDPDEWAMACGSSLAALRLSSADWFRAAIQAGYNAARPLDPGTVYVGGNEIPEGEVFDRKPLSQCLEDGLRKLLPDVAAAVGPNPAAQGLQSEPIDGSIHDRLMTMDVPRLADELHTALTSAQAHPWIPIIEEYMREVAQIAFDGGDMQAGFAREFERLNSTVSPDDVQKVKACVATIVEGAWGIRRLLGIDTPIMPEIADRDCSFIERDGEAK